MTAFARDGKGIGGVAAAPDPILLVSLSLRARPAIPLSFLASQATKQKQTAGRNLLKITSYVPQGEIQQDRIEIKTRSTQPKPYLPADPSH